MILNSAHLLKHGTPAIAYKKPLEFGKLTNFDVEPAGEINFKVLDTEVQNYEMPYVYNNLSSPITLTYINKNVKTNYQIRESRNVYFL